MTVEQTLLTQLIAKGINSDYQLNNELLCGVSESEWKAVAELAGKHKVTAFLYDALAEMSDNGTVNMPENLQGKAQDKSQEDVPGNMPGNVPEEVLKEIKKKAVITCRQDFNLLFMSKKILSSLQKSSISSVLLKGMATASYFANPLSRKSGDIDILLFDEKDIDKAADVMRNLGFEEVGQQNALHHVVFADKDGLNVELHTMIAEPFDSVKANKQIALDTVAMSGRVISRKCLGIELPMLDEASHAYELLLHMLQHYLRTGFGIRLLCDWAVFWNYYGKNSEKDASENKDISRISSENGSVVNEYLSYVNEIGIRRFSDMITLVCRRFLGLGGEIADRLTARNVGEIFSEEDLNAYMEEFMKAEEFGKTSADRMVALRGRGLREMFIEFDHQTALNFPKAYKVFIVRPFLWIRSYIRFAVNNRKIRKVSTRKVIKNARERGKLNEKLKFFA